MSYYESDAEEVVNETINAVKTRLVSEIRNADVEFSTMEEMREYLDENIDVSDTFNDALDEDINWNTEGIIENYGIADAINEFTGCDADDVAKDIIKGEWDGDEDSILNDLFDEEEYTEELKGLLKETDPHAESDDHLTEGIATLKAALKVIIQNDDNECGKAILTSFGRMILEQIERDTEGRLTDTITESQKELETFKEKPEEPKPEQESENTTESEESSESEN